MMTRERREEEWFVLFLIFLNFFSINWFPEDTVITLPGPYFSFFFVFLSLVLIFSIINFSIFVCIACSLSVENFSTTHYHGKFWKIIFFLVISHSNFLVFFSTLFFQSFFDFIFGLIFDSICIINVILFINYWYSIFIYTVIRICASHIVIKAVIFM